MLKSGIWLIIGDPKGVSSLKVPHLHFAGSSALHTVHFLHRKTDVIWKPTKAHYGSTSVVKILFGLDPLLHHACDYNLDTTYRNVASLCQHL